MAFKNFELTIAVQAQWLGGLSRGTARTAVAPVVNSKSMFLEEMLTAQYCR